MKRVSVGLFGVCALMAAPEALSHGPVTTITTQGAAAGAQFSPRGKLQGQQNPEPGPRAIAGLPTLRHVPPAPAQVSTNKTIAGFPTLRHVPQAPAPAQVSINKTIAGFPTLQHYVAPAQNPISVAQPGIVQKMSESRDSEIASLKNEIDQRDGRIRSTHNIFSILLSTREKVDALCTENIPLVQPGPPPANAAVPTMTIKQYKDELAKETGIPDEIVLTTIMNRLFTTMGGLEILETADRIRTSVHANTAAGLFARYSVMLNAFHRVYENLIATTFVIRAEEITSYISGNDPDYIKLLALYRQKSFWQKLYNVMVHLGDCLKTNPQAVVGAFEFVRTCNPTAIPPNNQFYNLLHGKFEADQELVIGLQTAINEIGKVRPSDYRGLGDSAYYTQKEVERILGKTSSLKEEIATLKTYLYGLRTPAANSRLVANSAFYATKFETHFKDVFRFDLLNAGTVAIRTILSATLKNLTDAVEIFDACGVPASSIAAICAALKQLIINLDEAAQIVCLIMIETANIRNYLITSDPRYTVLK
ncbi:MAG: hypothetical protein LBG13_02250 [Holosporales bacterium]|nr:hypothetical protein [Holosporales bacterium]